LSGGLMMPSFSDIVAVNTQRPQFGVYLQNVGYMRGLETMNEILCLGVHRESQVRVHLRFLSEA